MKPRIRFHFKRHSITVTFWLGHSMYMAHVGTQAGKMRYGHARTLRSWVTNVYPFSFAKLGGAR